MKRPSGFVYLVDANDKVLEEHQLYWWVRPVQKHAGDAVCWQAVAGYWSTCTLFHRTNSLGPTREKKDRAVADGQASGLGTLAIARLATGGALR